MSQVVTPKLAMDCMALYEKLYTSDDTLSIQKAFSTSVSFPYDVLADFITSAATTTDTLKICFGVYTAEFAEAYGVQEGRLTVFLCTSHGTLGGGPGGPPDKVLNIGNTQP